MKKDYYEILNVPRNATLDEITKAYRRKAMECHPDRTSAFTLEVFQNVCEAYETLKDEEKRKAYNVDLMAQMYDDIISNTKFRTRF